MHPTEWLVVTYKSNAEKASSAQKGTYIHTSLGCFSDFFAQFQKKTPDFQRKEKVTQQKYHGKSLAIKNH